MEFHFLITADLPGATPKKRDDYYSKLEEEGMVKICKTSTTWKYSTHGSSGKDATQKMVQVFEKTSRDVGQSVDISFQASEEQISVRSIGSTGEVSARVEKLLRKFR